MARKADAGPMPTLQRSTGLQRPEFFVVGHAKSGTTALYRMLREHPQIFMPDLKEPDFFAEDLWRLFRSERSGPLPTSLTQYLALFTGAAAEQRQGEASAFYLASSKAAAAISEFNPSARIIAVFREPVSYLRSLHLQLLQEHIENVRDLRLALQLESERREGRHIPLRSYRPQLLNYSALVRYTEQLSRYQVFFPPDQLLVLFYEDFRRDNEGTMRTVLRFLDVDDSNPIEPVEANRSVAVRSQKLDEAVHRLSVGYGPINRMAKRAVKSIIPRGPRRRLLHAVQTHVVYVPPPPPDAALTAELRAWLKPEVERFGDHVGRDLISLWGYSDE